MTDLKTDLAACVEALERRDRIAVAKALSALDAISEIWATEIGLIGMCENLAKANDVPAAIYAMAVQAWVEGAYSGRTSHAPAIAELQARCERADRDAGYMKHAGTMLSNIAYNLAQDDRLPDVIRWSLDDARKRWDAAIDASGKGEGND